MNDLATTRADTLDTRARGTRIAAEYTTGPSARNGWQSQSHTIDGVIEAVRVYSHGTVRLTVSGVVHHLPGAARVRVEPHLRVPDSPAELPSVAPPAAASSVDPDMVRAGAYGTRTPIAELTDEHVGREVEFDFQGTRFFGTLSAKPKNVLGMFSVVLDGADQFLFDDDQTLIVRGAAPERTSTTLTPDVSARATPAPAAAVAPTPETSAPLVAVTTPWVPVPDDELEFA